MKKRCVHTYSIDRWFVFFLRLFSVRLGLHASYQIIDRRNLEIESHTGYFKFKSPIDEDLLDLGVLLLQLLLHQDLFLVFHLAVLRDGGVAVELQLVVAVFRLVGLVVVVFNYFFATNPMLNSGGRRGRQLVGGDAP